MNFSCESEAFASRSTAFIRQDEVDASNLNGSHDHAPSDDDGLEHIYNTREGASDFVPRETRQIGVLSAVSLIFNRMIGTGIYATPSLILRASGSVGMFLVMWVLGATITSTGMAVYVEFGTGLPRSGGEKNYLEYVYRRPKLLVTCCFAMYSCLLGWTAANSVVFGEYMINALGGHITQWNTRFLGFACLSSVTLLHAFFLNWSLRLQNALAVVKVSILIFVVMCGCFAFLHQESCTGH